MKVPIDKLKFGVNRPQSWIDNHPKFLQMQEKMKESMRTVGQLRRLVISKNYEVMVGNQRLRAAIELGWHEIDCVFEHEARRDELRPPDTREWDPDKL